MDLIDRQYAIRIVDGIDTWQAGWRGNAIESLKALPSAQPYVPDTNVGDTISRNAAIDAVESFGILDGYADQQELIYRIRQLPSVPPEPSQTARDIATIIQNEQDMRVIKQNDIIRCKDCLYYQDNNGGYPHMNCKWDANETPDEDDFCSGAERRTDDANANA